MKKKTVNKVKIAAVFLALFFSCTASSDAGIFSESPYTRGVDGIVVQVRSCDGVPYRCWELHQANIHEFPGKSYIRWQDTVTQTTINIAGSYILIRVRDGKWDKALKMVGLTRKSCKQVQERLYDAESDVCGD